MTSWWRTADWLDSATSNTPGSVQSSERFTESRIESKWQEDFWQQHKNCESEKRILYPD